MKLKITAAVLGLVASAASQAALPPLANAGGSNLTLNVWEDGTTKGTVAQSFIFNLQTNVLDFTTTGSQTSSIFATLSATDATWQGFLATSSLNDLQWSVIGAGSRVTGVGDNRIVGTIQNGAEDMVGQVTNGKEISGASSIGAYYGYHLNDEEATKASEGNAYYLTQNQDSFGTNAWNNGNSIGATANVAELQSGKGNQNLANAINIPGTFTFAQSGNGDYVLSYNVSAVPEAPASTMALAGLGVMGLVARRRAKKSA
jgi:hypothetical protein